jgi:hypothetical protein
MNVKQIVEQYLRKHKCDGLWHPGRHCRCGWHTEIMVRCGSCGGCLPAVKRRRTINGKRRTVLVPVEVRK